LRELTREKKNTIFYVDGNCWDPLFTGSKNKTDLFFSFLSFNTCSYNNKATPLAVNGIGLGSSVAFILVPFLEIHLPFKDSGWGIEKGLLRVMLADICP